MENDNPVKQPGQLGPFLIILMFAMWGLWMFVLLPNPNIEWADYLKKPLSIEKDIEIDEVIRMGRQDMEHKDLLSKIREDLKIPKDEEIKIFIGPYANISGEGRLVGLNHPFSLILLLDETFYQNLTSEEKIALISHELGHLTNEVVIIMYNPDTIIRFQIEADTYATKYARPEAMISVLNKVNIRQNKYHSREYFLRIQNLEKIRDKINRH